MNRKCKTLTGSPQPLGSHVLMNHVNFSLFSEHATEVILCLFSYAESAPFLEISLDPIKNKTGSIWHIAVEGLHETTTYAYRINGPLNPSKGILFDPTKYLIDPYAKDLTSSHVWGPGFTADHEYRPRAKIISKHRFDWQGVTSPKIRKEDLIIYEMHVRGFTKDLSSTVAYPGTFLGIIEKIPYLKSLGINAVELLPIFEFDESENKVTNPINNKKLHNFWGYSTVNFFCPMNRYSTGKEWNGSINEFKIMVRELHRNGIEVILDVVYNHTSEGDFKGPIYSFKGIDNASYYILDKDGKYANFSGTGNTFNCNHPKVSELILSSLQYWAEEMHVDGFRFDLASIFTRNIDGTVMENPPIIQKINEKAELLHVKLIAEAWDAAGLYQVGSFPGQGRWSEWNGKFRDAVRTFMKGTDGAAGAFASALCGSEDLYGKTGSAYLSINFITAHDGYTLRDLVSYQEKHNEANGEKNQDGANDNLSWNCGFEGATDNPQILQLRQKQIKNFCSALFLSIGTPMMLMGDEYAHTREGNNNPYCQDNQANWFLWNEQEKNTNLFNFYKGLIHFRKEHAHLFCRTCFLTPNDVTWHGHQPKQPDWSPHSRFVAYTLHHIKGNDVYIAFNADYREATVVLPDTKDQKKWYRTMDTSLINSHAIDPMPAPKKYIIPAHTTVIMSAR
ncbi:MAG: glycogen debranching protein GlgX [Chlamydiae bacterium]|nr:glycogen debranching protein GlgX [Chlamydiota bacterium]